MTLTQNHTSKQKNSQEKVQVPKKNMIMLMLHYARYVTLSRKKSQCPEEYHPTTSSLYKAVYSLHTVSVSKIGRRTTVG
jgi:hypothetical protein